MERPTVIACQCLLGDGTTCGVDVPVGPAGNIPKYCDLHKNQHLRTKLAKEWERNQALAGSADQDNDVPATEEQESGEAEEAHRVCRARSCSIPLATEWPNDFCPAHWRLLPVGLRGELVTSMADPDLHETMTLRALREISRVETGVDSVTGKP